MRASARSDSTRPPATTPRPSTAPIAKSFFQPPGYFRRRWQPREPQSRHPRAKHALVRFIRITRRGRSVCAVVGRVHPHERRVLARRVLPMARTQMGRRQGSDWFVEVPHAGVSVVRGERALGIGRRVHGHRVHAGVGEAHREETEKGAVPEAEGGDGTASRRLSERRIIIGRCCINSSGPSAANAITAPPRQPWRPSPPPSPPSSPRSASPWRCA